MGTLSLASRTDTSHIDPRTKLAWLGVLLILVFAFVVPAVQFPILAFVVAMSITGGLRGNFNSREMFVALKFLAGMLIVVVVLQGFLKPEGHVILSFPLFKWTAILTYEGLVYGLVIASRFVVVSLAFMMFFITTSPYSLCLALYRLGLPFKYAYLLPMALDQFPRMVTLAGTIEDAQASRGFLIERGGLWQKFKNMIPIMIPLVVLSLREAGNMSVALELKGFGRTNTVTFLYEQSLSSLDRILLIAAGAVTISSLVIKAVQLVA